MSSQSNQLICAYHIGRLSGLFRANDLEASPRNGILRLFSSAASACK